MPHTTTTTTTAAQELASMLLSLAFHSTDKKV